jgi:CDGSH-type Zn-finger protein
MAEQVTIRPLRNGPYEVRGKAALVDHEGVTYPGGEDPVYLCRCGQSANKPFCDGTHKKVGFQADERVGTKAGR